MRLEACVRGSATSMAGSSARAANGEGLRRRPILKRTDEASRRGLTVSLKKN